MSISRPLGARSDAARQRDHGLRRTRAIVRARAGGRCEADGCIAPGGDLAHLAGRRNIVSPPLCDHPALCAWLCRNCHDGFDGRRPLRSDGEARAMQRLRWLAAARLCEAFRVEAPRDAVYALDVIRHVEREVKARGIEVAW